MAALPIMVRRGPLLVALCALAAAQDVDDDMGGDDGAGVDATGPSPPAADGASASSRVFKAAEIILTSRR